MKTALPWLVAVIGVATAAYFFNAQRTTTTQVAQLRQDLQELETLRIENTILKTNVVPPTELVRLRKDSEDVLRLRNEVRQLKERTGQLTQQAQTAQAAVDQAQAQAARAQAEITAIGQRTAAAQQLAQEQAPTAGRQGGPAGSPQEAANACINNLRHLDGAKQQWALENSKTAEAVPNRQDLSVYFKDAPLPQCPLGGSYVIGSVNAQPTCSIPGHALPQ